MYSSLDTARLNLSISKMSEPTPQDNLKSSVSSGIQYGMVADSPELAKQLKIQEDIKQISSTPALMEFYQSQPNVDMTVKHLDELADRSRLLTSIQDRAKFYNKDYGAIDTAITSFNRTTQSMMLDQARDKEDAVEIARRQNVLKNMPDYKSDGVVRSVADGIGSLAGTMYYSAPEMARNELMFYGATAAINAATGGLLTPVILGARGASLVGNAVSKLAKFRDVAHNLSQMEAIAESTARTERGSALYDIAQANPNMDYSEVRKRADAVGDINGFVEAAGWAFGIPQASMGIFKLAMTQAVKDGTVKAAVATSKPFWQKAINAVVETSLSTVEELSEQKMQDLISDAGKNAEQDISDGKAGLVKYGVGMFMKDAINMINPLAENNDRNKQFLSDTANMRNALLFAGLFGRGITGAAKSFSDGQPVSQTKYQKNIEDLDFATRENQSFIDKIKELNSKDGAGKLNKENREASTAFNIELDKQGAKVSMDPEKFREYAQQVLENEETTPEARQDIDALQAEVLQAEQEGRKMDIPYSKYSNIFQSNGELFQSSTADISPDGSSLSQNEIKNETKRILEQKDIVEEELSNDAIYHSVMADLKNDTKLSDQEKSDIAATYQIMGNTLSSIRKTKVSPSEFWSKHGAKIQINNDVSLIDKAKDLVNGTETVKKRGAYDSAKNLITIMHSGDATTYLHEFSHYFMSELEQAVSENDVTEHWLKNYETAREWAGAKTGSLFDMNVNREASEKIAQGFERYLAEGVAPTPQLTSLFARIADAFIRVYNTLTNSGVQINDSIRKVYGQMFANASDIEKANRANGLFVVPKPKGVSAEFYDAYMNNEIAGNRDARMTLFKERARMTERAHSQEMQSFLARESNRIRKTLSEMRVYRAIEDTKNNKLDINALKEKGFKMKDIPIIFKTNEYGADPSMMAAKHGYTSVTDYINDLIKTKSLDDAVEEYATAKLNERLSLEGYKDLPFKSAVNENYFKALIKKAVMAGERMESEAGALEKKVIDQATKAFNEGKTKDAVKFNRWRTALQKNAEIAARAGAMGDTKKAYRSYLSAAHAQIQSILSNKAHKKMAAFNEFQKKYNGNKELRKALGQENYDAIVSIMNNFGIKNAIILSDKSTSQHIEAFIDRMLKKVGIQDAQNIAPFIDLLSTPINVKDMKYKDFALMNDVLRAMEAMSRKSTMLRVLGRDLEEGQVLQSIIEQEGVKKISSEDTGILAKINKFYFEKFTIKPTFMKEVFGDYFCEKILFPLKDGFDRNNDMAHAWKEKAVNALLKHNVTFNVGKNNIIEDVGEYSNENLLMMALNIMSNEHNRENLYKTIAKNKYAKNDAVLEDAQKEAINRAIPDNYWEAANEILGIFREAYPLVSKAFEDINGYGMGKVNGTPFTTPSGKTYEGGYFPAIKKVVRIEEVFNPDYIVRQMSTLDGMSFVKDRTEAITGDLDLTSHLMLKTFYNMSTMINVLPHYNTLVRLLDKYQLQISNHIGDVAFRGLATWVKDSIIPDYTGSQTLAYLDSAYKVAVMGLDISKGFIQAVGFVSAVPLIGMKYMAPQIFKALANPFFSIEKSKEKSEYMKGRFEHVQQTILGETDLIDSTLTEMFSKVDKTMFSKIREASMWFLAYGDSVASNMVWQAQYNKSITEGKSPEVATQFADDMVRQTQGDFSSYAKPEWFKGMLRLASPFMTYFINMGSNIFSISKTKNTGKLLGLCTAFIVFQPFLESMIREVFKGSGGDDDEDKDYFDRVWDTYIVQSLGGLGNMIFPFGGVGSEITYLYNGKRYQSGFLFVRAIRGLLDALRSTGQASMKALGFDLQNELGYDEYAKKITVNILSDILGILPKKVVKMLESDK